MALNQDVYWFVPFHTHNPTRNVQCICYAPTREARCRAPCERPDNRRAIKLHKTISDLPAETVDIQLIKEYILCICCRFARHRDRIEDVGLLTPLAERWLDEIKRHAAEQSERADSAAHLGADITLPGAATVPNTPTTGHAIQADMATANTTPTTDCTTPACTTPPAYTTSTAYTTPTASLLRYQYNIPTLNNLNTTSPIAVASALNCQVSPSKSSTIDTEIAPIPSESQPRYDLRPRNARISANATSVRPKTSLPPPLSEFRAHIAEPGPTDSVSSKIQDNLKDRDFETGSLYIFDRTSSPGHVKIGWTASSVSRRLDSWSECGYTPNLLFRVDGIPRAQRAETLTHYELIKEWRRERMCKAEWCRKSHQEWFEVSKERAERILGDWAKFMKVAEPYDSNGHLKIEWNDFVRKTVKSGETVTVAMLLEHYEQFLANDTTLVEESTEPKPELKIEEQEEGFSNALKLENVEDPKEAVAQPDSLPIELTTSAEDSQLFKSEASPAPAPITSIAPLGLKEQPRIDQIKSLQKDIAAEKALVDKELSPEQIQLSPPPPVPPSFQSVDLEDGGQVKTEGKPGDTPIYERAIKVEDADGNAVTEVKPSIGNDEWADEETLVEIVTQESLKEAALKIVEGLCPDTSIGKSKDLEVLESEVTPAVQVVAQA